MHHGARQPAPEYPAHPGGLAGELGRGEDVSGAPSASCTTGPQGCCGLGNRFGGATLRGEGQRDKKERTQAHFLAQHMSGNDTRGHRDALWTRGRMWLRSGCVDEMEELSWPPSSLSGRHCRKCPVSRVRSPNPTDPWTPRNVHRSSLEGTQGPARSAGPAQSLPARCPSPVASWVSQLGLSQLSVGTFTE